MLNRGASVACGIVLLSGLLPVSLYGQKSAEETVAGLKAAPGLEVKLWASEPLVQKPTDMDIDSRGRIWICEGTNYRSRHTNPDGDCIVILEDTKHTGVCDSRKVFVQDKSLNAPLGVCVLGNKVYVAMSPNVLVYTIDASGDHPVGPPEILFNGFGGANHDHAVHAGVFGPDGRYYFNSGNEGTNGHVMHDGKPVVDRTGSEIGRQSKIFRGHERERGEMGYQDGMAFSCNLDGSNFEVLGSNFRNNYELCVDSFGTVWQSDNDDDGNQGVRINYVMEGGDFGYKGPKGSDWSRDMSLFPDQTRQEAHWHQRFPGVVPNMLHTGAGAPTGIANYEGNLLPAIYHGAIIHADAGRNVIRAYLPTPSKVSHPGIFHPTDPGEVSTEATSTGAGYDAQAIEILKLNDHGDSWFRPSDVCVAPDGSLYICDWYDPGVGGHATGDTVGHLHGRVYRLAPTGSTPSVPKLDLDSTAGQIAALCSPNGATRYLGYTALSKAGESAVPALRELYNNKDAFLRARALWLLSRSKDGQQVVTDALKDKDVNIRIAAFRAAREINMDVTAIATELLNDPSPMMARELCLAMQFEPTDKAMPVLVKLADKYDGEDRWYLEALGIGATGREKELLAAWEKDHRNNDPKVAEGIAWRLKKEVTDSRGNVAASDAKFVNAFWALGPLPSNGDIEEKIGPDKNPGTIDLGATYSGPKDKQIKWEQIKASRVAGGEAVDFVEFCTQRGFDPNNVFGYFATSIVSPADQKAKVLVGADDGVKVWLNGKLVHTNDVTRALTLNEDTIPVQLKKGPNLLLCKLRQGNGSSGIAVSVAAAGEVTFSSKLDGTESPSAAATPSAGGPPAAFQLSANADPHKVFKTRDGQTLPPISELMQIKGDAEAGAAVFRNTKGANCIHCHQIGNEGNMIGPPLTTVGTKLNKGQILEAILYPSASILMHYETWIVRTKAGDTISGLLVEDTNDHLTLKDSDGKYHDVKIEDVDKKVMQKISLMPEGLSEAMTRQDLVNLVEYLSKQKS